MKDVTSTSFGLIIAFLLPGLVAVYSSRFWSQRADELLATFETAAANVGLFFFVILVAVATGLQVTLVRWFFFERWLCRDKRLKPEDFARLGTDQAKLAAFRSAVDEHYRYHQFWGGMTVVMPFLFVGWYLQHQYFLNLEAKAFLITIFVLLEILTAVSAIFAFDFYVTRGGAVLRGGVDAERLVERKEAKEEGQKSSETSQEGIQEAEKES